MTDFFLSIAPHLTHEQAHNLARLVGIGFLAPALGILMAGFSRLLRGEFDK